jgi:sugar/nucleoside kinase (ribokinase family)
MYNGGETDMDDLAVWAGTSGAMLDWKKMRQGGYGRQTAFRLWKWAGFLPPANKKRAREKVERFLRGSEWCRITYIAIPTVHAKVVCQIRRAVRQALSCLPKYITCMEKVFTYNRLFRFRQVRPSYGVDTMCDHFRAARMATWEDYDQCSNEAAAQLKPGDFNWQEIFAGGVRWFHSGGIFAALSTTTAEVIIEAMQAAKAAGAITSFDLNYRAKLWNIAGGPERAVAVLDRIIRHVDVLVGNEEDLQLGLGIPGPAVAAKSKLDPSAFFSMMGNVIKKHPHIKIVATTLREVHSTNRHSWGAVAWIDGATYVSPTCELDVVDRVGGGDGYAAGFFYGLLGGESPQDAVNLGWAHGALLTTFPGDTTMATAEQVRAFAHGGSARIQR